MEHSHGWGTAPTDFDPATTTLNEVVERRPETHAVLASLGLDSCCGGAKTLEAAARLHGIPLEELLRRLNEARG